MRRAFIVVLAVAFSLMALGVVVFHFALGLDWIDSVYFVVATMTTVGYGDINLADASPGLKLFGNFLMLAGAASLAAMFGVITAYVLKTQMEQLLGFGRKKMQDHVVLCGLGNIGIRVLEHLLALGEKVVVIESSAESRFTEMAKSMKARVIEGDMRADAILEQANIREAKSLIAVSSDDLANLEAALNARAVRPDIHVVLRIFDANLASKLESGFGIRTAFSTSALSAPGFAMAALDRAVVGSFYVGDELMVNVEMVVTKDSRFHGKTTEELRDMGDLSVVSYVSAKTGERQLYPSEPVALGEGDRIVVSTARDSYRQLLEMNAT